MSTPVRLVVVVALIVGQAALASVAFADATGVPDERTRATGSAPLEEPLEEATPLVDALEDATVGVVTLLVPPAAHLSSADRELLENDVRRATYDAVVTSPGTHLAGVASLVNVAASTVRYHAHVLERAGLVRSETDRGKRRLYPAHGEVCAVGTALTDQPAARLVRVVDEREPIRVGDIATALDRAPSTVSYHLDRLEVDDVVTRERTGEAVEVTLTLQARSALEDRTVEDSTA